MERNNKLAEPLIEAVRKGGKELVRQLLLGRANPNDALPSDDDSGKTPLMMAAERGSYWIVQALLEHGANPNQLTGVDHDGRSAFCDAVDTGSVYAFRALMRSQKKPEDCVPVSNPTPAIIPGRSCPIIGYLIAARESRGLDRPSWDKFQKMIEVVVDQWGPAALNRSVACLPSGELVGPLTPLMLAVKLGNRSCVDLLLQYRVDVNIQNADDGNKTASDYAREVGRGDLVDMIERAKKK